MSSIIAGVKNIVLIPGMFTIEKNQASGNFVHKHKSIKFDVMGKQRVTKFIQIS